MADDPNKISPSDPVRVVVADDHPVVRSGICEMLASAGGIEVAGEAADGEEALRLARSEQPDVLLLDVEMPGLSGVEVARHLGSEVPDGASGKGSPVRILALSSHDDPEYVRGLMESGASGYLTKEKAPFLIEEAVRAVARGEVRWFVQPGERAEALARLTEREHEILQLLAEGHANREIAERLSISGHTVRSHTTTLYDKIGVSSGREAIVWAWQSGLMSRR